jgi:hypothetical protein
VRDDDDQGPLVLHGTNDKTNREGEALEQRSKYASPAGPLRKQAGTLEDTTRDSLDFIEKGVAQSWAPAAPVVGRFVLEFGDGLVEQVDAEQADDHLPPGPKPVENGSQVLPLCAPGLGSYQTPLDLGSPRLGPLLGGQIVGGRFFHLAGKDPRELGRQSPSSCFNLVREDTKGPRLNLRCSACRASHF